MVSHISHTRVGDRILRCDVTGPITLQSLLEIEEGSTQQNTKMRQTHKVWASMMVMHQSARIPDDLENLAYEGLRRFRDDHIRSPISCLVIAPDVDGHGEVEPIYARLNANAGNYFKVFDAEDKALNWMQKELELADAVTPQPPQKNRVHVWQLAPQIMQYEMIGPIDLSLFLEVTDIEKNVLQRQLDLAQSWSSIIVLSGDAEFKEDGLNFAQFFMQQRLNKIYNQVSSCCVIKADAKHRERTAEHLIQFYDQANLRFRVFDSYSQALSWTREQLANANYK